MTFLAQLKSSTQSEHDSIEKRLNLLDPEMDMDRYGEVLKGFYGIYARLLPEFDRYVEIDESTERMRLEAIEKDLVFLNLSPAQIELPPSSIFSPKSLEEALGALYVLRGSSLGAQFLSRHFERHLKLSLGKGLDFFSGDGSETMPRWIKFKEKLETLSRDLDQSSIIVSAKKTFSELENWLTASH